jgi:hypothetical protein
MQENQILSRMLGACFGLGLAFLIIHLLGIDMFPAVTRDCREGVVVVLGGAVLMVVFAVVGWKVFKD